VGAPGTYKEPFTPPSAAARLGKMLFRHRGVIPVPFILGTVVTLILCGDTMAGWGITFRMSVVGCIVLCAIGHVLRVWAVGHAGHETRQVRIAVSRLATSGPFRYTRNPIYIGNLLIALGLALVSRTAWVALAYPPLLFLQYHFIIRYEEEYLEHRFGDEYRAFRERTPRYIGHVRRGPASTRSFEPAETLRKEYEAVLATVSTAAVFVAARMLR
jgi:protein-S-isoprenylcysteine O-methyltransferase Ste14